MRQSSLFSPSFPLGLSLYSCLAMAPLFVNGCGDGDGVPEFDTRSEALLAPDTRYSSFKITNYTVALESELSGGKTGDASTVCPPGLSGRCYYREFLCSGFGVAMQGSGIANDGKIIKFVGGGGPWTTGYGWWQDCEHTTFTFASGVTGKSGRTLSANYSIAVDPSYISYSAPWYVWIDSLNRWFQADDTGGAIKGYHIDVYTGTANPHYNLTSGVYITATPHAATDPSPYGSTSSEVVIDDGAGGFSQFGPTTTWYSATIGYGGRMLWTFVNGGTTSNYARWTPSLPSNGTYTVSVYVPSNNATSQQAKYRIYHGGSSDYAYVNQNAYSNAWVSLGRFNFTGAGGEYVELGDGTGESYSTRRKIGVDAVKFTK